MNRRTPAQGEQPADFLAGVVWDAIRDAREAGMPAEDVHVMMSGIARQCDPMGFGRVFARPPTREELLDLVKLQGSIGWDAALALGDPSPNVHVELHRKRAIDRCAEYLAQRKR